VSSPSDVCCGTPGPRRNGLWCILTLKYDIWWRHFAENQLTKFSAGDAADAGDFSDAAGEREMAPKCGSLPRDTGDLVGLHWCTRSYLTACGDDVRGL